jgi:hypothetical protein
MYKPVGYTPIMPYRVVVNALSTMLQSPEKFMEDKSQDQANASLNSIFSGRPDVLVDTKAIKSVFSYQLQKVLSKYSKLYRLSIADLIGMPLEPFHFISHYLQMCDRLSGEDLLPVVPCYNDKPLIKYDDMLDAIVSKRVSPLLLPRGEGAVKVIPVSIDTVVNFLVLFAQHITHVERTRKEISAVLHAYAGHLLYRVKQREPLTKFEKTFILQCMNPEFGFPGTVSAAKDVVAELEAKAIFSGYTYSDFGRAAIDYYSVINVPGLELPLLYVGPYTPNLIVSQGYLVPFGPFSLVEMSPRKTIPWTIDHVRNHYTKHTEVPSIVGTDAIALSSIEAGPGMEEIVGDMEGVNVVWDDNEDMLTLEYYVGALGRDVRSVDLETFFLDYLQREMPTRETPIDHASLDRFRVIDTSYVAHRIVYRERKATFHLLRFQDGKIQFDDKGTTINLKSTLRGGGDFILPALGDYFTPGQESLYEQDPSVIAEVQNSLNLTNRERSINKMAISIQYNAWYFRSIIGSQEEFLKESEVKDLVRKILRC